jgi:hypothetical protein
MSKLFTGNGFLTKEGERFTSDFRYGLSQIMSSDEVADMSLGELQTLQSNLAKMVGDAISKRISHNLQLESQMNAMTDEQFYAHLQEKYGDNWILHSLEKEERARLPVPDMQKLADEMKYVGEEIRKHMIQNGVRFK